MDKQEKPVFDPTIDGGVVVGHDGSARSATAIGWAVEEARLRGLPLHVVRAWKLSNTMAETGVPFGTVPSWDECAEAAARSIDTVLSQIGVEHVQVHRHVVHGSGSLTLLTAAEHADLLVVGERGAGGFAGIVIGSVAEQVVRHSPCTTVLVRGPRSVT